MGFIDLVKGHNEFGMRESWAGERYISEIRGIICFAKENLEYKTGKMSFIDLAKDHYEFGMRQSWAGQIYIRN